MTRFTATDVARANADWLCSCGPAALAAICGLALDEVRPLFTPAFPGWTTPTRMLEALRRSGRRHTELRRTSATEQLWPTWGLARVQWHGPWTQPGANPRWAYTHTHWVAAHTHRPADRNVVDIWDVNELGEPTPLGPGNGWLPLSDWSAHTVPRLTADIKRATGGWHLTHSIEVERR